MFVLIIEDEKVAADRLSKYIQNYNPDIKILDVVQSVSKAVGWFDNHPMPDLAFFDIQLADGISFEIFEKTRVECPVIFTTAYEEYMLKAFKVNSIDYILKPYSQEEINQAIEKFEKSPYYSNQNEIIQDVYHSFQKKYKERFIIKINEQLKIIPVEEIQLVYSMEKATFIRNFNGRDYAVNYSIDQIESLLDPKIFYRISRKYMVHLQAIKQIHVYSNSRLKLDLSTENNEEVIVSRERVKGFKEWIDN